MVSNSQNSIKTEVPCTDSLVQNTKGKWINRFENNTSATKMQKEEAFNRLDGMHDILMKMFPQPIGVDVRVSRSIGISYFGASRKYRINQYDQLTYDYMKIIPLSSFSYYANFSPHYCVHTDKGIVFERGERNENGDGTGIWINDFSRLANPPTGDDWTINGQPVAMMSSMITDKWKGYEMYGDIRLSTRSILIHRKGMFPYNPVTRKQYLDRCLEQTSKLYDKIIEGEKQMPVRSPDEQEKEKNAKLAKFEKDFGKDPKRLKSAVDYYLSGYKTDQQIKDERIASSIKLKERELKRFNDELEKTKSEGLLDSPAVIRVMYISDLIFDNDPRTGSMLVTENPDYIRKDLPTYIPQFIIFSWRWSPDFYPAHKPIEKLFLQDFPIEKIQAMIDK